jgi:uncharacterized protein (DUF1778 family)
VITRSSPKTRKVKRGKAPEELKQALIQVRVTTDQRQRLKDAADRTGLDLSSWLRMVGLRAALEIEKQGS